MCEQYQNYTINFHQNGQITSYLACEDHNNTNNHFLSNLLTTQNKYQAVELNKIFNQILNTSQNTCCKLKSHATFTTRDTVEIHHDININSTQIDLQNQTFNNTEEIENWLNLQTSHLNSKEHLNTNNTNFTNFNNIKNINIWQISIPIIVMLSIILSLLFIILIHTSKTRFPQQLSNIESIELDAR